jgi:glycosyltransferase involved in cell wall biosynthesis
MLHYVPLETIDARYSRMLNSEMRARFDRVYHPQDAEAQQIETGQFLDVMGTTLFKSRQLALLARAFDAGEIADGDVILFADLFFPGLSAIDYMSDLAGIDVRTCGFCHAGRAEPNDFIQECGPWADHAEQAWLMAQDLIFVGSLHHARSLRATFDLNATRIEATGIVFDTSIIDARMTLGRESWSTEQRVVWPHRPDPDKGVEAFLEWAHATDWPVLVTTGGSGDASFAQRLPDNAEYRTGVPKGDYYDLLARSTHWLSTARQENFGYALREASYLGCRILAPRRECYPDVLPDACLYETIDGVDDRLDGNVPSPDAPHATVDGNANIVASYARSLQS